MSDDHVEPVEDDEAVERWMQGYYTGWSAQGYVDRFRAFVSKPFDECDLEDLTRFEAALVEEGVDPLVRSHTLERVDSVLWSSRWRSLALDCPHCAGHGPIQMAQIHASGERIYHCIECDQCWDSLEAVTADRSSGPLSERFPALKWWQLAPVPE